VGHPRRPAGPVHRGAHVHEQTELYEAGSGLLATASLLRERGGPLDPRYINLYAGQTGSRQWDDVGYNFLVDRCGTIYEGRAGGVERAVVGAHTQGFNRRTSGIAAIGTFTAGVPVPKALTDAIAALAAWKLGLSDIDPRGTARLVSSNGLSRYAAGTAALLPAVVGHRAGFSTTCPGAALQARLPAIREAAARLQGRIHGRTA